MMSTVTNTQVAVKYRRDVDSLSIDMSANNRTTTLGQHIDQHISRVSVNISTDAQLICRLIYRVTPLGRLIDRHSTDMSTDISVNTWPICWLIYRSTVGWYVNRYVGRGVYKIQMIPIINEISPLFSLNFSFGNGCWNTDYPVAGFTCWDILSARHTHLPTKMLDEPKECLPWRLLPGP